MKALGDVWTLRVLFAISIYELIGTCTFYYGRRKNNRASLITHCGAALCLPIFISGDLVNSHDWLFEKESRFDYTSFALNTWPVFELCIWGFFFAKQRVLAAKMTLTRRVLETLSLIVMIVFLGALYLFMLFPGFVDVIYPNASDGSGGSGLHPTSGTRRAAPVVGDDDLTHPLLQDSQDDLVSVMRLTALIYLIGGTLSKGILFALFMLPMQNLKRRSEPLLGKGDYPNFRKKMGSLTSRSAFLLCFQFFSISGVALWVWLSPPGVMNPLRESVIDCFVLTMNAQALLFTPANCYRIALTWPLAFTCKLLGRRRDRAERIHTELFFEQAERAFKNANLSTQNRRAFHSDPVKIMSSAVESPPPTNPSSYCSTRRGGTETVPRSRSLPTEFPFSNNFTLTSRMDETMRTQTRRGFLPLNANTISSNLLATPKKTPAGGMTRLRAQSVRLEDALYNAAGRKRGSLNSRDGRESDQIEPLLLQRQNSAPLFAQHSVDSMPFSPIFEENGARESRMWINSTNNASARRNAEDSGISETARARWTPLPGVEPGHKRANSGLSERARWIPYGGSPQGGGPRPAPAGTGARESRLVGEKQLWAALVEASESESTRAGTNAEDSTTSGKDRDSTKRTRTPQTRSDDRTRTALPSMTLDTSNRSMVAARKFDPKWSPKVEPQHARRPSNSARWLPNPGLRGHQRNGSSEEAVRRSSTASVKRRRTLSERAPWDPDRATSAVVDAPREPEQAGVWTSRVSPRDPEEDAERHPADNTRTRDSAPDPVAEWNHRRGTEEHLLATQNSDSLLPTSAGEFGTAEHHFFSANWFSPTRLDEPPVFVGTANLEPPEGRRPSAERYSPNANDLSVFDTRQRSTTDQRRPSKEGSAPKEIVVFVGGATPTPSVSDNQPSSESEARDPQCRVPLQSEEKIRNRQASTGSEKSVELSSSKGLQVLASEGEKNQTRSLVDGGQRVAEL